MSSSVQQAGQEGYCSKCHKVWTLETEQGVCQWCGRPSTLATRPANTLRSFKSTGRRKLKQAAIKSNGYDHLDGQWATYYRVALPFSHKARVEDREDLLHTIIANLADAGRNNGHKPDNDSWMYRIASFTVADYWRAYYKLTNGLDCTYCNKAQRRKCKKDWLYPECPKAIKLESLNKPVMDDDGNLSELGNLLADDQAIDLDAWLDAKTFLLGTPYQTGDGGTRLASGQRLIAIAQKRVAGILLDAKDKMYLQRFRERERNRLF